MAIEIVSFRQYQKNTLQGFLTVRMTNVGLEIRDITLHEKEGKRCLGLPAKPYTDRDGKDTYAYIVCFYDRESGYEAKFRDAVMAELKKQGHIA